MDKSKVSIIACSGAKNIGKDVSQQLQVPLVNCNIGRFSDGEIEVQIFENVRKRDVFILQSTCSPVNDNVIELALVTDALKRSAAERVIAVMPYFGYSRQDRRIASKRVPISAKVMANIIAQSGVNNIITVDVHSEQIQGFFNIPVDNLYATTLFEEKIKATYRAFDDVLVVSPDVGGVLRARALTKKLPHSDMAIVDKRREKANSSEVMNIIGDVTGKHCVILDDIIDTAGTITQAADALMNAGAKSVEAYITHGVLSGPALERINASKLTRLIITDSIMPTEQVKTCDRISILPIAPTLADAMERLYAGRSISEKYGDA